MGGNKGYMAHLEEVEAIAREVGVKADLFQTCDMHGLTYVNDSCALEEAYKIGNAMISRGEIIGVERRDLTDAIKKLNDQSWIECARCADEAYD